MSAIKSIEVSVGGFDPVVYSHVSPAAAFVRAWGDYCNAYECTFRHFMKIARRRKVENPEGVGAPIRVCGRKAWTIEPRRHSTRFVYDGERTIMTAHHSEIQDGHEG